MTLDRVARSTSKTRRRSAKSDAKRRLPGTGKPAPRVIDAWERTQYISGNVDHIGRQQKIGGEKKKTYRNFQAASFQINQSRGFN